MKSIDIRTTQNVTIEYELASLRERFLALFIDLIIVGALYFFLFLLLTHLLDTAGEESGLLRNFIYVLLPTMGFLIYQFLSEILASGQSWGKRSMGIKVIRLDGQEPGLSDYLLRSIFYIIDLLLSFGILGALLISSSARNQRLGDMTANTAVIRMRNDVRFQLSDILRINTLEDYEPSYPAVKQLSEADMLTIKQVISRYQTYRNDAHQKALQETVLRVRQILDIQEKPSDPVEFLRTLLRDYIVLTR